MPKPTASPTSPYHRLVTFAERFAADHSPPTSVDGTDYELPGLIVYHSYRRPLPDGGRVEINIVTAEAAAAFEWSHEITRNDKVAGQLIHLIMRPDGSAAETYGKTVTPITPQRANAILSALET